MRSNFGVTTIGAVDDIGLNGTVHTMLTDILRAWMSYQCDFEVLFRFPYPDDTGIYWGQPHISSAEERIRPTIEDTVILNPIAGVSMKELIGMLAGRLRPLVYAMTQGKVVQAGITSGREGGVKNWKIIFKSAQPC